ncbi:hypothetical protein MIMGU_mgv1a023239mg, partial [Erythranthe guttata]
MAKKLRAANSIDKISELPTDILHKILYYLSHKEAVRTSLLSKAWRYIWCTLPNLDFSDTSAFTNKQHFVSIVNSNLQRYFDQRTCLQELHLSISLNHSDRGLVSLLKRWIPLLKNMGTKKFCLSIRSARHIRACVELPSVVFGAESLHYLHVQRFVLGQKAIQGLVIFKHLKSLHLQQVCIDEDIFHKIILSCPSIETMRVDRCMRLRKIKGNDLRNLKDFFFSRFQNVAFKEGLCRIEIHPPSIEKINITCGDLWLQRGANFLNLKDLCLRLVRSSLDHLSSCKFPCLRSLKIWECEGLKESHIFIDAPKIVYFEYGGDFVPHISIIATSSRVWDSYLNLRFSKVTSLWYFKLNKLLKLLSHSNICVEINQYSMKYRDMIVQENINLGQDDNCDKPVVVERLSLRCHVSLFSSLLEGTFRICRPRNIGDYHYRGDIKRIECLWKILMKRESGREDRKFSEVRMEIYERNKDLWHPTTLSQLPNYQPGEYTVTRFAIK